MPLYFPSLLRCMHQATFAFCQRRPFSCFSVYAVWVLCLIGSGCHWAQIRPRLDYKTVPESPLRDSVQAKNKHDKALRELSHGNIAQAEQLVQESLLADVSYGPSHNTLGKILYDQQKYYFAAWEFEYAMKSMPDRLEPHNNLGLVYEAVGRLDDAIAEYQTASEIEPANPEFLGNLLRAKIRRGEKAVDLKMDFEKLLELETRDDWRTWCQQQLAFAAEPTSSAEWMPDFLAIPNDN